MKEYENRILIIVYNIPIISSLNINQVIKMTVNWQRAFVAVTTLFYAQNGIKFAIKAKMIAELIFKGVHGIISATLNNEQPTDMTLSNKVVAERINLTKLKLG
ncbi:hypothetical protein NQT69_11800 [Pseudoalteromonas shioyasakiensis]|uniref:hypothetical protein n=1 Tax=Pseudoalteromonas shioyasakiensis TaxID=1190813 RepID=UPI002118A558|nr:hypothetical protein [Pseudoalteromonas shioyasakiensis]MCQ8878687.1 hypothetical protein [Pseudoalteromonas shioyasakiensis]